MRELIALKEFCISQGIDKKEIENLNKEELIKFMINKELLFDMT